MDDAERRAIAEAEEAEMASANEESTELSVDIGDAAAAAD